MDMEESLGYVLYSYRKELYHSQRRVRLIRKKIDLTGKLCTNRHQELDDDCSMEELKVIGRELLYQKELQLQLEIVEKRMKPKE